MMTVKDMTENAKKKCFDRKKRGGNAEFDIRRRKNFAFPTRDAEKIYALRYGDVKCYGLLTVLFDFYLFDF
jgi:hypothetical protein